MWCDFCGGPVAAQKNTHKVRNGVAGVGAVFTSGLTLAGAKVEGYVCPTCGNRARPATRGDIEALQAAHQTVYAEPEPQPDPRARDRVVGRDRYVDDDFRCYVRADGTYVFEPLMRRPGGRWATACCAVDVMELGAAPEQVRRAIAYHTDVVVSGPGRLGWLPDGVAVAIQEDVAQWGGWVALSADDEPPAATTSTAEPDPDGAVVDRLAQLSRMLDAGHLTPDEFAELKARLLGGG